MKKLLALMVLPVFLAPLTIISTEHELVLTEAEKKSFLARSSDFSTIPKNPRLFQETRAYLDDNLTEAGRLLSADESLVITELVINDNLAPVFKLNSGQFIEASQLVVFDDVELSREQVSQTVWLKAGAKVYDKPYVIGAKKVKTDLVAHQQLLVTEQATTHDGVYYLIAGKGWVSSDDVYTDVIDAVQALLLDKYQKNNLAIYIKRLDDGAEAGVNADQRMYGASITKLATIYETQRQLNEGAIKLTDTFKYIPEVNQSRGFYAPEGAGNISKTPDGKDYTVEDLLKAVTKQSDNVASNMLGYYVANQLNRAFQTDIWLLLGEEWDMVKRDLSARAAGQMMAELYHQGGEAMAYMMETAFDNSRISKDIAVPVAHKTGDADEFRHDVGVVYAERPFVLSVLTAHSSYDEITAIANDVYHLLK